MLRHCFNSLDNGANGEADQTLTKDCNHYFHSFLHSQRQSTRCRIVTVQKIRNQSAKLESGISTGNHPGNQSRNPNELNLPGKVGVAVRLLLNVHHAHLQPAGTPLNSPPLLLPFRVQRALLPAGKQRVLSMLATCSSSNAERLTSPFCQRAPLPNGWLFAQ